MGPTENINACGVRDSLSGDMLALSQHSLVLKILCVCVSHPLGGRYRLSPTSPTSSNNSAWPSSLFQHTGSNGSSPAYRGKYKQHGVDSSNCLQGRAP